MGSACAPTTCSKPANSLPTSLPALPTCLVTPRTCLQAEERDRAVQRLLYVDLLNLLALDSDGGGAGGGAGGSNSNGARVRAMLDASGACLPACLPARLLLL